MKFEHTNYSNTSEILKFTDHYVNLAVTVSDAGVTAVNGKKVVKAGTLLGGGFLQSESAHAVKASTAEGVSNAQGVLFYDVDVTHGPASGAALIHGFVAVNKLPVAPTAEEITALKQITFVR